MDPLQPIQPDDHVRGAGDAPVTIVEYGDYDCPHTRAAQDSVDELLAGGGVRFVFRHFPLRRLHVNAEILARVAEAAQRQDLFWPMHDHLMHHRRAVERDDMLADAEEIGLDLRRVNALLDDPAIAARIERDVQGGGPPGSTARPASSSTASCTMVTTTWRRWPTSFAGHASADGALRPPAGCRPAGAGPGRPGPRRGPGPADRRASVPG